MEPGQGNFPRKIRPSVDISVTPDQIDQIISGIKSQIEPVGTILDYTKMFMPDMSKRVQFIVGDTDPFYVYKINVPGFIYRQHVAGDWDAECGIRVIVSNRTTFNKAYLYLDTKGAPVNANDHGNNLFPVRPGDNTYMIFSKYNVDDNINVYFVPALGTVESAGMAVTRLNPISYPTTILPGALTDSEYLSCFASSTDFQKITSKSDSDNSGSFPTGFLACVSRTSTDESNLIVQSLDELLKTHPVKSGELPSVFPDMCNMQVMDDSIYRVNVAGYFYRHIKSAKSSAGSKSGIVLAPTLSNMEALDVGIFTSGPTFRNSHIVYGGTDSESSLIKPEIYPEKPYTVPARTAVLAQTKLASVKSNTGRVNYTVMTGNDRFGGTCLNMIPIVPGSGNTGLDFSKIVVHSSISGVGQITYKRGSVIERVRKYISGGINAVKERIAELNSESPLKYDNFTYELYDEELDIYCLYYDVFELDIGQYEVSPIQCTYEGDGTFVYYYHDDLGSSDQYYFVPVKCAPTGINALSLIHESLAKFTYGLKSEKIRVECIYGSKESESGYKISTVNIESNKTENKTVEYFNRCFGNSEIAKTDEFAVFIYNLTTNKDINLRSISYPKFLYDVLNRIQIFSPRTTYENNS